LRHAEDRVSTYVENLEKLEAFIGARLGIALEGMDILDIGPGPFHVQMIYFARKNRVLGVDTNVNPNRLDISRYLDMFRYNGVRRGLKTVGRKIAGIDRQYRKAVKSRLSLRSLPDRKVLRMDACNLTFPDSCFDFVHSRSVFHHLPIPAAAIDHIVRILRPGGIAYLSFQLFTSENGSLDPRIFTSQKADVGLWPHLRPSLEKTISPNAFLNKLRLSEWRQLFEERMPAVQFTLKTNPRPAAEADALRLQKEGELRSNSLEELLTDEVAILWRKPASDYSANRFA
jgi:SAM-dependent methyltransferase